MYQGKNTGKIDISYHTKQLPTLMKAFINSVLASNVKHYHYGARRLLLDDMYACLDLVAILFEEMDLIGGGTCRKNRIGFKEDDEWLKFPKVSKRGAYRWINNRRFHILATRFKDSKTL